MKHLNKKAATDLERAAKAKEVIKAIGAFSKERNIDPNQALLLAGGSMYFRGLKDNINDIDFMHPALKDFTKQTIGKYELDGGPGGMPEDAYASDNLYGLNVQKPEAILSFYKFLNRPKDQQKIQMLSAMVTSKPNVSATSTPMAHKDKAKHNLITAINKSAAKDALPGGSADNMPDSKFNKKKLRHAQKHEMEHTVNPAIAKEVAKDHMLEDENYYKKIEKIEKLARLLKTSTIRTTHGHESDANVTSPALEDIAFLGSKPSKPKAQPEALKFNKNQPNSKIRNAVIAATKDTLGSDPSLKQGSWAQALESLKQLGVS